MAVKKVAFVFDPFKNITVARKNRTEARQKIKDFVKEEVLTLIGDGKTPVQGGKWKRSLSKGYKSKKAESSSVTFANLELDGDMLDALEVVDKPRGKLSLQIVGPQAGKADGNNRGTYGKGSPSNKKREFIPKRSQTLKRAIWNGIDDIAKEFEDAD